jgi:transcriptional regulator with XRE-family HTH domain
MKLTEAFALVLRSRRTQAGLTQAELATGSGLHAQFVSRLELAKAQPTLESVAALARGLNTTAVSLVEETEKMSSALRRAPRPKAR